MVSSFWHQIMAMVAGAAVWGQLMGPEGWFGQSIRAKPAATVQGSGLCRTLFVHAGLLPNMLEVRSYLYSMPLFSESVIEQHSHYF